jgi:hypothetical protein
MSARDGTVVSAPSSPSRPAIAQPVKRPKLPYHSKHATFVSPIVRGTPFPSSKKTSEESGNKPSEETGAAACASSEDAERMFKPSALDDGSLVCVRCHEIVTVDEIESHESVCEMNQNEPSLVEVNLEAMAVVNSNKQSKLQAAKQPVKKGDQKAIAPRAQSSHSAPAAKFSMSDIRAKAEAKRAAAQKAAADEDKGPSRSSRIRTLTATRGEKRNYDSGSDLQTTAADSLALKPSLSGQLLGTVGASGAVSKRIKSQSETLSKHRTPGDTSSDVDDDEDHDDSYSGSSSSDSDFVSLPSNIPVRRGPTRTRPLHLHPDVKRQKTSKLESTRQSRSEKQSRCALSRRAQNHKKKAASEGPSRLMRSALKRDVAPAPHLTKSTQLRSSLTDPNAARYCMECGLAGGSFQVTRAAREYFSAAVFLIIRCDQVCHEPGCRLVVHQLCCGYDSQTSQRRFTCPRCSDHRVRSLPRMRYVACIVASCPGDSDAFGVWLG